MKLYDYLKVSAKIDKMFCDIIDRTLKRAYIHHAKQSGASEEELAKYQTMDSVEVGMVVEVLYGAPIIGQNC